MAAPVSAQFFENLKKKIEKKLENKADTETNKAVDKALDFEVVGDEGSETKANNNSKASSSSTPKTAKGSGYHLTAEKPKPGTSGTAMPVLRDVTLYDAEKEFCTGSRDPSLRKAAIEIFQATGDDADNIQGYIGDYDKIYGNRQKSLRTSSESKNITCSEEVVSVKRPQWIKDRLGTYHTRFSVFPETGECGL